MPNPHSLKTCQFTPPQRCTCQVRQNWIDDVSSTPPPTHPPAKSDMHADLQLPHFSHAQEWVNGTQHPLNRSSASRTYESMRTMAQ
ncbi:hypothetical protein EV126DRAFT_244203 [Verticillium dahliae]|nr:hypothetical protein EV126DRAFT_244203 [Verticillium dahliae]